MVGLGICCVPKCAHQSYLNPNMLVMKVWCHHKFQLPGMLLHDTLEHRANRTRAPNESLDFDVHGDLPWLSLQVPYRAQINPLLL